MLKTLLRTNFLNDVTTAPFSVSVSQLPAAKNYRGRLYVVMLLVSYTFVGSWVISFKGQIISKWFFVSLISSKNRTKEFDFTTIIPQVDLFLSVFKKN